MRLPRIVLTVEGAAAVLLFAAHFLPSPVWAMWSVGPVFPKDTARQSELVVMGRMVSIDHDLVKFGGRRFSKHVGKIRVEKVLLKEQGETVPEVLRVYWGNWIELNCPLVLLAAGRYERGAWLLRRSGKQGPLVLFGPEEWFFVRESELEALRGSLTKAASASATVIKEDTSAILRVRYLNFTDTPRDTVLWSSEDGGLRLPAPLELVACGCWDEVKQEQPELARSLDLPPGEAESITVPPHSYVERTIDVSDWLPEDRAGGDISHCELRLEGKTDLRVPVLPAWAASLKPDPENREVIHVLGDMGTPVWWYPAEPRVLLAFGILCPVLLGFGLLGWRRRVNWLVLLSCGTLLGLAWTWGLAELGRGALCLALIAWFGGSHGGYLAIVLLGGAFFGPPLAVAVAAVKQRLPFVTRRNALLLWGPWLALPGAALAIVALTEGIRGIL